jgi:hypothetical protein
MVMPMVKVVAVVNVMVVVEVVWMSIPVDHNVLWWKVRQMRLRKVGLVGRDCPRCLSFLEVIQSLFRGAAFRLP